MAFPIITALRQRKDLKESVKHSVLELAHRASIYGVVRVSNRYMGEKCDCHQRTFQRHVLKLEQAHILKKKVVKKVVKIRVGEQVEERLRNEINTYTFTIAWQKSPSHKAPMDKMSTNLPPQETEKESSVREELERQKKGIHFLTPGSDLWRKVSEEIVRLEAMLIRKGDGSE